MKHIKYLIAGVVSGVALLGCVKDPINDTNHPDHGQIILTTDWSRLGTEVPVPESYIVKAGQFSATLTGATNTVDNLFLPGTYHIDIYNTVEHITVDGHRASVATVTAPAGATGVFINSMPGWFHSWTDDLTIEADTDYDIIAMMQQQVRKLTFLIQPTGGAANLITGITATLSGVAQHLDMDTETLSGQTNIVPVFTKVTSGPNTGNYIATVRLLGITGSSQKLGITVDYSDSALGQQVLEFDMSSLFTSFNDDKRTPLVLGAQMLETPTGTGFGATISNWIVVTENLELF